MVRKLLHTVVINSRMSAAILINRVIYFFKRLPFIGKAMPDAAYGFADIKTAATVIMSFCKFFMMVFGKVFYYGLVILLPMFLMLEDDWMDYAVFVNAVVFMNMCAGAMYQGTLLENKIEKYTAVKLMRMPARRYYLSAFADKHISDFIGFLPVMIVIAVLFGHSVWEGVLLSFLVVMAHCAAEAFLLFLFDKTRIVFITKVWYTIPALAVGVFAYLPMLLGQNGNMDGIVFSIPFVLAAAVMGALGCQYVVRYRQFKLLASATLKKDTLVQAKNAAGTQRTRDVQLKHKDFSNTDNSKFEHLKGYRYFNAIFFERHKRVLTRYSLIVNLILICAILAGTVLALLFPELANDFAVYVPELLPVCVFLMYILTATGERTVRAMFANCDAAMLRYPYYRQPDVIMKNFRIRLNWLIGQNMRPALLLSVGVIAFAKICGVEWPAGDMLLFTASIILLGVFFSVHYLFLYYFLQPYSTDLAMKNPFFQIVHSVVYLLCFVSLQMPGTPKHFTIIVLGATILYSAVALLLVWKCAPKNFRIK